MSQHCFKPKSLEAIIVTLCPWYQKTSYKLSTHNSINTSILTGRNKSTLRKEQTKARPKANRENTKPFSSISGIWYSWWNHLDSRGLSSPASFATWVLHQWTSHDSGISWSLHCNLEFICTASCNGLPGLLTEKPILPHTARHQQLSSLGKNLYNRPPPQIPYSLNLSSLQYQ